MNGTARRTFRCFIHPRPAQVARGSTISWEGLLLDTLDVATVVTSRFDCTYDEVADQWSAIDGFYLEPDGSFAWVGNDPCGCVAWHLEGQLTDGGPSLAVVELGGHCTAAQLDRLLRPLGWPESAVVFQLRDLGVFIDEKEFRRRVLTS